MGNTLGTASAENNGNLLAFTSCYAQSCHHSQQQTNNLPHIDCKIKKK